MKARAKKVEAEAAEKWNTRIDQQREKLVEALKATRRLNFHLYLTTLEDDESVMALLQPSCTVQRRWCSR